MDRASLHIGRIIRYRRLPHNAEFDGFPVFRRIPLLFVPGQLVFTALSQEMEIMAIVNHLDISVFLYKVHVFFRNVRPV